LDCVDLLDQLIQVASDHMLSIGGANQSRRYGIEPRFGLIHAQVLLHLAHLIQERFEARAREDPKKYGVPSIQFGSPLAGMRRCNQPFCSEPPSRAVDERRVGIAVEKVVRQELFEPAYVGCATDLM
jgi:hypothetical protein